MQSVCVLRIGYYHFINKDTSFCYTIVDEDYDSYIETMDEFGEIFSKLVSLYRGEFERNGSVSI